jgi:uroporphyrinogen decarboxylase
MNTVPTMTHRDRVLAAIQHRPVDRFPTDIWAVPEVWDRLYKHFHVSHVIDLYDRLGIDGIFGIDPAHHGPLISGPDPSLRYDEWGFGYRMQDVPGGVYEEQVYFPLQAMQTVQELEKFPWPSPDDYDYSVIPRRAAEYPDRAIMCGYSAIFYWHNRLRGLEQSLIDPLVEPEMTRYLIQRVSSFFQEYHRRCFEAGKGIIDVTQVTDDYGSQNGLLISPRIFDQFYRQPMQIAMDLAHSYGISVFHHDDGDLRRLLPRLVEMGINVLNPIQWRCGDWDLAALKGEYGNKLCFHGAVDNQETLPFGNVDDVRAQVRRLKSILGSDRTGFIIAPCHNIQAITPVDNIIAMYETAIE